MIKKKTTKKKNAVVSNGISEAIMGFTPGGMGVPLSQTDTLFANNRWYLVSNMRQVLSEIYAEHGLVQTIVDIPVEDGLRGGVTIKSKQLSPEQIEDLQVYLDRQDILNRVVGQAHKWNRLFGGAGILILTDQDPKEELNIDELTEGKKLDFRAVDMWELFWNKQNDEGYNPAIQEQEFQHYDYYGLKVHKSRVMRMTGMVAPSFIRPRLRGWGLSVIEPLVRSINQYLKANNLSFEVLDEFKIDVYRLKNLAATMLSAGGSSKIQQRVQLTNQQKNFQNAITLDSEDEYTQKQLSFSGIAETMREIRMQVASDMRMPLSKLFGISASGFNSGEDDIENYNAMIESSIRAKAKYEILKIIELVCHQKFGMVPDDLRIEFSPLRILSAEQEETVKTAKFNRLMQAKSAGEMTTEEFKEACNKDDLLGIQLDTTIDTIDMGGDTEDEGEVKVPTASSTKEAPQAKEIK